MILKFGLEVMACLAARDAKDDFELIRFKVETPSGSDGRRARSSDAIFPSCSHAKRPASPSVELTLRMRELDVPGRLEADRAVDGLDTSD